MDDKSATSLVDIKAKYSSVKYRNRLMHEKSPYLLQHAANPVDWFAWGPEAFDKARKEDKPIFLSIGYSTCHWCHVMERETFENEEAARLMNETFVSIKVDREERPDIDNVYMTVCQMLTGGGGWPLSIIMTPDKKPFFAGTYVPLENRFGRIGMKDLTRRIKEMWTTKKDEVVKSADKVLAALHQLPDNLPGEAPGEKALADAFDQLARRFDEKHGGFSQAPKFPTPHNMLFLLRYWVRTKEDKALQMVEQTLQSLRRGGIYDHVGFGFHRYSTDEEWLLPHFEKMLYDQALLAMAYTEAYLVTGKDEYAATAQEIFAYVMRDMTDPKGGFYSAEDADTEGEEGKFYVWTLEEVRRILGERDGDLVGRIFNAKPGGNFRDEATGRSTGTNILHTKQPLSQIASEIGMSEDALRLLMQECRARLFEARKKRVHPHKDDKILTDWNGLMVAAFSKGAQAFHRTDYADAARKAADFLLGKMSDDAGRLLHRYREGDSSVPGLADDYAFFIWGLLELYEATFEERYLDAALKLNDQLVKNFWDDQLGGFYFTASNGEKLLTRKKEIYDGAIPSGNSVAALNLLRLARITANPDLDQKAQAIVRAFAGNVGQFPSAYTQFLTALEFEIGPSYEVVIAGDRAAGDTGAMLKALRKSYVPNKVVILRPSGAGSDAIIGIANYTKDQISRDGRATAYVCRNFTCERPTTDVAKMLELLGAKTP